MVNNDRCERCGEVETYKHLMWECGEVRKIWMAFNEFSACNNYMEESILEYEDVFKIGSIGKINKVKLTVIQSMIQIERPMNWTIENIKKLIMN